MFRRIRDDRPAESPSAPSPSSPGGGRCRRPDRRRRPDLEGLEGRQLLSDAAPPAVTAAVASPTPTQPARSNPVVFRHTPLPTLRAWSGQPFDGVVASFIANSPIEPGRVVAAIDWGDGRTSVGTIEPSPWGGFNVRGEHSYDAGVSGPAWIRVDLVDAATGSWLVGVEQRAVVSRASPARASLVSAGFQPASSQAEPSARPQPGRLRFVERRQRYHGSADRFAQGTASADDIRYLKQVKDFKDSQDKGFFEKVGDEFVNTLPFS